MIEEKIWSAYLASGPQRKEPFASARCRAAQKPHYEKSSCGIRRLDGSTISRTALITPSSICIWSSMNQRRIIAKADRPEVFKFSLVIDVKSANNLPQKMAEIQNLVGVVSAGLAQ
ncbi:MAG: hypothetical protein COW02_18900 [Comamonadaceae bacterium CG12_big_fil_rev_8_21_14_0_65_59_15]|nr:MAG: hypothetical protein COW02_18900 [Comamonadaceae bacterium CG12_big_fil_rev_8_21_14_0_65_59_15]